MLADVGVEVNVTPPDVALAACVLVAWKATTLPTTRERSAMPIMASCDARLVKRIDTPCMDTSCISRRGRTAPRRDHEREARPGLAHSTAGGTSVRECSGCQCWCSARPYWATHSQLPVYTADFGDHDVRSLLFLPSFPAYQTD